MPRTYLFYDTETSGLHVAFDQVVRFAAIRTDEALRELERHAISVRLRPDIIPHPDALLTTGLSMADLQVGDCEFEAITRIHALFNTPGTVTIGYNSLSYDDELLRFSFYRNLLPPYDHHRAGRLDLLPMTVMVRLLRRHWLAWPEVDGKQTLKLEHLNRENCLSVGRAHDAMVDVEAALELARRYHRETKEWEWLLRLFDPEENLLRLDTLPALSPCLPGNYRFAIATSHRLGAEVGYVAPVVSLGRSIPYGNQSLWLRLDRDDLAVTAPHETWAIRKKESDDHFLLVPKPRYVDLLRGERLKQMNDNRRLLESEPKRLEAIAEYHRNFRYPEVPEVDTDAALYLGFLSDAEKRAARNFHTSDDRAAQVEKMPTPRMRALALRVLGRNYPEQMPACAAHEFAAYMRRVHPLDSIALVDYRGKPRYTPSEALARIAEMFPTLPPEQSALLEGLRDYLGERFGLVVVAAPQDLSEA